MTKQAFNETFLANLEGSKGNIGALFSSHVNKEESKKAINSIFPPALYGYSHGPDENPAAYDKEIQKLLRKYTADSTGH